MWTDILFDLDGTLTDSGPGISGSARYALEKMGRPVPPQAVLNSFVGPPLSRQFPDVCGFNEEETAIAIEHFRVYFAERGIHQNEVYPGIKDMLARLVAAGRRLHLATTKPLHLAQQVLNNFDLTQYFTCMAGTPPEHGGRDKPEIVREVLENAQVNPQNAVMVGDRLYDVEGAHENALPCIGVLYGYGGREELSGAGCDYLVGSVEDLERVLTGY